ncbi:hypothetical protein Q757_08515 [Oenococcus alcoholitolerans]|uniref:Major facilitator superfamily (MFS) profile domain-containing protein n=1 Tax=Oenococcus alcoholitolerans TaxID=931074 RepID=A0ABR4XP67_9LACO|nr:hypothetical protein Q757_08515 [Oenococcus alcoholitolerans]
MTVFTESDHDQHGSLAALVALIISVNIGRFADDDLLAILLFAILVRSITQVFQQPTLSTIVPAIVPKDQLTKINGQIQTLQSLTTVIAPGISAVLFGLMPIQWIILFDLLGAVFGSLTILAAYVPPPNGKEEKNSFIRNFMTGFSDLAKHKGIFQYSILSLIAITLIMPSASLYPLMTTQHFGGTIGQAGIVETTWSVGSLLGGLFISIWGAGKNRFFSILFGMLLLGTTFLLFGFFTSQQHRFLDFCDRQYFIRFFPRFYEFSLYRDRPRTDQQSNDGTSNECLDSFYK